MADQLIRQKVDDLDAKRGRQTVADETVEFGLDGVDYSIDLSHANAKELRSRLQEYLDAATPVMDLVVTEGMSPAQIREAESRAVRRWAERQGVPVAKRGKIPADVLRKYEKAHGPLRYHETA